MTLKNYRPKNGKKWGCQAQLGRFHLELEFQKKKKKKQLLF